MADSWSMPQSDVARAPDPASERARAAEHEALLGVLAHELRTPITTIYAGSAVLARDEDLLPAMRRELASDVYHEAARLFRAVEDLLVLTRLEHDAVRVTREPISLIRAVDAGSQIEGAALAGPAGHAPARRDATTGRRRSGRPGARVAQSHRQRRLARCRGD